MSKPQARFSRLERPPRPSALTAIGVLLFALSFGPALLAFQLEHLLARPEPLLHALEQHQVYAHLPTLLASTLASDFGTSQTILSFLPKEQMETFLRLLLPEPLARQLTEQAIRSLFAHLNGSEPAISLPLTALKAHLAGPAGEGVLLAVLNTLPACSLEQLLRIAAVGLLGSSAELPLCRPPDELLPLLNASLRPQLLQLIETLPDSIILSPQEPWAAALHRLRQLRILLRWSPLLPIGLLIALTLSAHRWSSRLTAWGWALLLGGGIGLALAVALPPLAEGFIKDLLQPLSAMAPAPVVVTIHAALLSLFPPIARSLALSSALLVGIGALLLTLVAFLSRSAPAR